MMSEEEYKTWRKEQHAKTRMKKRRKPHLWSDRKIKNERKLVKYGLYKWYKRLPGSFESNFK